MISDLIVKYLNGNASEEEVELIFEWIDASEANKKEFITLKKAWMLSAVNNNNQKLAWKNLKNKINKTKPKKYKAWFKYAALLILFIAIGKITFTLLNKEKQQPNAVVLETKDASVKIELNKAHVTTPQGQIIAKQNNNEIIYKLEQTTKALEYHTLKIPLGKTFKVTLSDGTKVHLNSGTTFKYPKQFSQNSNRLVFLEGEAFFEVETDKNRPFIVNINNIGIEVLGTKFNLNSYPERQATECVLVEGSVKAFSLNQTSNNILLTPKHKASWHAASNTFKLNKVDTALYTSWIYGEIILESAHFSSFSKKLERAFNVKIVNNNKLLEAQEFSGTINFKTSTLEDILDLLKFDTFFEYHIKDNQIIISNN
ncbi:FecR family protein [Postechiella marina]|uniref:FecR family protein n=1 Tax=Postechiella marina TaxID=943941 RepID=A0ABP8C2N7_9FLAO